MNFSAKLRFYFQTRKRFREKLQKKLGSHALYQAKKLCDICEICVTKNKTCLHANMQTCKLTGIVNPVCDFCID